MQQYNKTMQKMTNFHDVVIQNIKEHNTIDCKFLITHTQ